MPASIERIRAHSLFVLGVQKAGTTSLHTLLAQHPSIAAANPKEPNHYIKIAATGPMILATGPAEMAALPYFHDDDYRRAFSVENDHTQFYLDSSTGYLPYDEALDTIAQRCTSPRVIVVLRDPVSRAYSAYNWARKMGWEPLDTFEAALEAEDARRAAGYWFSYWYRHHSLYAARIKAVTSRFPFSKFILFDDLKSRPGEICQDIFAWLGLPPVEVTKTQANRSGLDRGFMRQQLRKAIGTRRSEQGKLAGMIRAALPARLLSGAKRQITDRLDAELVPPAPLAADLKASLACGFEEEIGATETMLGRDLSAWRQP